MTRITSPKLFTPTKLGAYELKHRIVMAPLTRLRAETGTGIPSDWAIKYYTQRASDGGLLISEGTFISEELRGYENVPGIYTQEQIAVWKKVTAGVHSKGGKIFLQLWVLGRVADPKVNPKVWSAGTISDSSATPHKDEKNPVTLTQIEEEDMDRFVGYYEQASKNAIEAGFDGVEVHNANGYLLDQFIQSTSNNRNDGYGGSLENRFKFPLRVINAVAAAVGPSRVGVRISPFSEFQGMREKDPLSVFVPYTKAIIAAQPELAYIHSVEGRGLGTPEDAWFKEDKLDQIRDVITPTNIKFIVAGGYSAESALEHAEKNDDLITFGRYFISNPDLPNRVQNGWPLKKYNRDTFYTPTAEGYIDYPTYQADQNGDHSPNPEGKEDRPEVAATEQDASAPNA
ncbi:hypothetical protein CI109_104150 [Kwoniella shandongensis]|uniref:Uncharacterized protein n=1 Tax=Kwoniella shandongensis TaxID=1734106 RepID=A0A5M6C0W2_9TREE|nr:uncharacterized protein CI109_002937 [Kwoniella shandongensis]KAA5528778.1 hypothetical protein CI109_002937 [Kwoniella shandongensis]